MNFINDREVINEIAAETGIAFELVDEVVSVFSASVAEEIRNSQEQIDEGVEKVIEIKHLGKFITKKHLKNGKQRSSKL